MRDYRDVLRQPGVIRLLVGAMPARLAYGMVALSLFFLAKERTGSLAVAGLAVGANTLMGSAFAPVRGGLVDRFGQTVPLAVLVPSYASALLLLGFRGDTAVSVVLLSALAGLVAPPINLSARPLWKLLVTPDRLRTAWALDSVLLEVTGVLGPLAATVLAVQVSAQAAVWVCASLVLVGGGLLATDPRSRAWVPEAKVPGEPGVLRSPAMQVLALEGVCIGLCFGVLEVAVPSAATLAGVAGRAALLMGAFALGSVLGGIRAGTESSRGVEPLGGLIRVERLLAVVLLALPWVPVGPWMVGVLLLAGFVFGPAQVFYLEVLDACRPRGTAVGAQAFVWSIEGAAVALGSAVAGHVAQAHGARPALLMVSGTAFLAPLVLQLGRGRLASAMAARAAAVEHDLVA